MCISDGVPSLFNVWCNAMPHLQMKCSFMDLLKKLKKKLIAYIDNQNMNVLEQLKQFF